MARGYSVVYDTAIHVFACLEKQKFGGATEEELRMAERVMVCDLLILDDLGTEMSTSFIAPALYSIINGRILAEKPTIISTNYTMDQLAARYTPQILSRLEGEYHILTFAGRDIRRLRRSRSKISGHRPWAVRLFSLSVPPVLHRKTGECSRAREKSKGPVQKEAFSTPAFGPFQVRFLKCKGYKLSYADKDRQ